MIRHPLLIYMASDMHMHTYGQNTYTHNTHKGNLKIKNKNKEASMLGVEREKQQSCGRHRESSWEEAGQFSSGENVAIPWLKCKTEQRIVLRRLLFSRHCVGCYSENRLKGMWI